MSSNRTIRSFYLTCTSDYEKITVSINPMDPKVAPIKMNIMMNDPNPYGQLHTQLIVRLGSKQAADDLPANEACQGLYEELKDNFGCNAPGREYGWYEDKDGIAAGERCRTSNDPFEMTMSERFAGVTGTHSVPVAYELMHVPSGSAARRFMTRSRKYCDYGLVTWKSSDKGWCAKLLIGMSKNSSKVSILSTTDKVESQEEPEPVETHGDLLGWLVQCVDDIGVGDVPPMTEAAKDELRYTVLPLLHVLSGRG